MRFLIGKYEGQGKVSLYTLAIILASESVE